MNNQHIKWQKSFYNFEKAYKLLAEDVECYFCYCSLNLIIPCKLLAETVELSEKKD